MAPKGRLALPTQMGLVGKLILLTEELEWCYVGFQSTHIMMNILLIGTAPVETAL